MQQALGLVSVLVRDYDEALAFYVGKLGFTLVEDTAMEEGKRWVVVCPTGQGHAGLLLARAATPKQKKYIGNQSGGRVFLFLHTDDFARDHAAYTARGVAFAEPPRREAHGTVAIFSDLYGNRWELIEPAR